MRRRSQRLLQVLGAAFALAWLPGCDDDDLEDSLDELDDVDINVDVHHSPGYETVVIWPGWWYY